MLMSKEVVCLTRGDSLLLHINGSVKFTEYDYRRSSRYLDCLLFLFILPNLGMRLLCYFFISFRKLLTVATS